VVGCGRAAQQRRETRAERGSDDRTDTEALEIKEVSVMRGPSSEGWTGPFLSDPYPP
jgi:hypothetical protein